MRQLDFMKDPDKSGDESIVISDSPKFKLHIWSFLVCALLALIVWLYVVDTNYSTVVQKSIMAKVSVVGADQIEENEEFGITYNLSEILVTVQGAKRDFEKYGDMDLKLILDVSEIDEVGEHTIPLKAEFPSGLSISGDCPAVKVYAYEIMTTTVKLSYNIVSNEKFKYECDPASTTEIVISGPKDIIEKVDYAMFTLSGALETDRVYTKGVSLDYITNDASTLSLEEAAMVSYSKTEDLYIKINVTPIETESTGVNTTEENITEQTAQTSEASSEASKENNNE